MKKEEDVNIISFRIEPRIWIVRVISQIARVFLETRPVDIHCYGLGTDNKMYFWDYRNGEWFGYWGSVEAGMEKVTKK